MEGMEKLLPEDVLTNIIRRLAPRYLAISRCVCKTWCATVDACNLLRADLLPWSMCGIFINFNELGMSEFFSRPSKGPTVSGNFDYLPLSSCIIDHCNGLLLFHNYVVNPATRQSAPLPPCPSPNLIAKYFDHREYLVFDPTLSPHYEVFMVPWIRIQTQSYVRYNMVKPDDKLDPAIEELEWPPSPCILHVFSSRMKVWEERSFFREGEAAGTVADMALDCRFVADNSVYWRGVFYVHCHTTFVMRISLSNGKYQVIKRPVDSEGMACTHFYLGKSVKGVYIAVQVSSSFSIYILDESSGKMEWVFKHSCYVVPCQIIDRPGPWTLEDINNQEGGNEYEDGNNEATVEDKFEWDSDNDNGITESRGKYNGIDTESRGKYNSRGYINFLGFHPYKEVVFLSDMLSRGLAYHLNSSKIEDLGNLHPTDYGTQMGIQPCIQASFPYTPWMGQFPEDD
ncbi:unnamed protein product [Urochloa humidicola]